MPSTPRPATYIALLRAVNVAGHNRVGMADLRRLLGELGLRDVRSLLQSGNLIFSGDGRTTAELESWLARTAEQRFGLDTEFFVRTASEWAAIVAGNPFPEQAGRDPGRLVVALLKRAPARAEVRALERAIIGREVVRVQGRHAYIFYPDGIGRSRLSNAVIETKLGTSATARNWNTVLKLDSATR